MSRESLSDLNTRTLIGNTDARGTAWHYRADLQAEEPNHYPGPIPVEDVRRRLFDWHAISVPVATELPADLQTMTHLDQNGHPARWSYLNERQAICRDDTFEVMGIFAQGYAMHQYDEWLVATVADILDSDLAISSAGLLRSGAIAWVEVSMPESIITPEGVEFRPNLLATTSFDGSIATTFKRTITDVVCDNTRETALAERGPTFKVKHSRHSTTRLSDAREALQVVHSVAESFAAEIHRLCQTTVSQREWSKFLDRHVPIVDKHGARLTGRARSIADKKRARLDELYRHDIRVAPWAGTAHGVLQAVNTFEHHDATVRGATRPERNMLRAVTGEWARIDSEALQSLHAVLA
ncbi:DUF932 domain-containing protein [Nocardioides zeae]|uniref:DUF932 domain-containing protein n=1 Tax=Nocardioides imazamoxiresistens TaxID=3231893 RepID=A0ABU3PQU8_9ACTN|nr:DUF932 domain-containing protein [Nocardioides zeae]MDT9591587.1 DUF932 domain-containing protein [Nocardioides zeae]